MKEVPTTKVEPPPGIGGGGIPSDGANVGFGSGGVKFGNGFGNGGVNSNGAGVTREEVYGMVWGLAQGFKVGGRGKGGNGDGGEYHPDLDERQFRRVDKFKGESGKFKGRIYEVSTSNEEL